jgi:hypothetical protein
MTILKNIIFPISVIFAIIFIYMFCFWFHFNENDVIPYARAVYDNDWLPTDWYLNLQIPYRFLFSYVVGFFAEQFGFIPTIMGGRLLTYALMAFALFRLIQSIGLASRSVFPFVALVFFFKFFGNGNGASEWLIGGFDTKAFAYIFVILSLAALLSKRLKTAFLFAGFSLTFHMLVGIYHAMCLGVCLLVFYRAYQPTIKDLIGACVFYLLAGSVGVYGVIDALFIQTSEAGSLGWDIYVNKRVPHHLLPYRFPFEIWIKMAIFSVVNMLIVWRVKHLVMRQLSAYALLTVGISMIGLLFYFTASNNAIMRFYFFRTSDVMLPLITLMNVCVLLFEWLRQKFESKLTWIQGAMVVLCALVSVPNIIDLQKTWTFEKGRFLVHTNADLPMSNWVKENTSNLSTFITVPNDEFFYLNYERSAYVTWKHSPQKADDLVEWNNRLSLLNKGKPFMTKEEVKEQFLTLTKADFLEIQALYPDVKYVLMPSYIKLDFPLVHQTKRHVLFKIEKS